MRCSRFGFPFADFCGWSAHDWRWWPFHASHVPCYTYPHDEKLEHLQWFLNSKGFCKKKKRWFLLNLIQFKNNIFFKEITKSRCFQDYIYFIFNHFYLNYLGPKFLVMVLFYFCRCLIIATKKLSRKKMNLILHISCQVFNSNFFIMTRNFIFVTHWPL